MAENEIVNTDNTSADGNRTTDEDLQAEILASFVSQNGVTSGKAFAIANDTKEIASLQTKLELLEKINKELEVYSKKGASASADDYERINALLKAQASLETDKSNQLLRGNRELTKSKGHLKDIFKESKQLVKAYEVMKRSHESSVESLKKELVVEQKKTEGNKKRNKSLKDINTAKLKSEKKYDETNKKWEWEWKPQTELYKMAKEKRDVAKEYNKYHDKKVSEHTALYSAGLAADVSAVASSGVLGTASSGMSGGLGGVLSGASNAVKGLASLGGPWGMAASTIMGPMMDSAIQAYMLNMERGIRSNIFSSAIGKLGGVNGDLRSRSSISLIDSDIPLSMDEMEKARAHANGLGIDISSKNPTGRYDFKKLAAADKFWGGDSDTVMKELSYATGNYRETLERLNDVMVSTRSISKSLNISQGEVAQQMANAGLQARLAGTDAYEAVKLYKYVADDKSTSETLKNLGIDFRKDGGAVIGGMASVGQRLGIAQQYYLAATQGGNAGINPLMASYKMTYGGGSKLVYDKDSDTVKVSGTGDFYGAKNVHKDLMSKFTGFKSNGLADEEAFIQTQMYAQKALGLSKKDVETMMSINPDKKSDLSKAEEILNRPDSVLSQLQSMQSINEKLQSRIAGYMAEWNPVYKLVEKAVDKILGNTHGVNQGFTSKYEDYRDINKSYVKSYGDMTDVYGQYKKTSKSSIEPPKSFLSSVFSLENMGRLGNTEMDAARSIKQKYSPEYRKAESGDISSWRTSSAGYEFTTTTTSKTVIPYAAADQMSKNK